MSGWHTSSIVILSQAVNSSCNQVAEITLALDISIWSQAVYVAQVVFQFVPSYTFNTSFVVSYQSLHSTTLSVGAELQIYVSLLSTYVLGGTSTCGSVVK